MEESVDKRKILEDKLAQLRELYRNAEGKPKYRRFLKLRAEWLKEELKFTTI